MDDEYLMIEIINNIFAIDYVPIKSLSFKNLSNKLNDFIATDSTKVIFSMCRDGNSNNLWIVAATKYYNDDEIIKLIRYMLETDIYLEYYMGTD